MACRLLLALLPLAVGCTLTEGLDGYAGGAPADAVAEDASAADTSGLDGRADAATTEAATDATADAASDAPPGDTPTGDASGSDARPSDTGVPDTGAPDTGVLDTGAPDTGLLDTGALDTGPLDTGPPPYRHTVAIDGVNDFAPADKLATTTPGFDAWVSWDATSLYVGYAGVDLSAAGASSTKWVLVYVDVDPGSTNGTSLSEPYGAQQHRFGSGFLPDVYYALKTDESYQQLRRFTGSGWINATGAVTFKRAPASGFVELKIPLAALAASPTRLSVATFMLNEDVAGPWTWAGLYPTSFTDGLSPSTAPKTLGNWLSIDLASSATPNAASNKRP